MQTKGDEVTLSPDMVQTIEGHWRIADAAAQDKYAPYKAGVARVTSHLDEVDTDLLRIGPICYVAGQFPGLLSSVRQHLPGSDSRRRAIEAIARRNPALPTESDREVIVAAHHAASQESLRAVARVRSFTNVLGVAAIVLIAVTVGLAVFGFAQPDKLPLCFSPTNYIVCPTSTTKVSAVGAATASVGQTTTAHQDRLDTKTRRAASPWDMALVEGVGLVAAALAAAISLRGIRGTSTPYRLPVVLSILKLPTGALTAVLGLLLMRGQFVPGLSALDTSAQIIAWAVLFGYSQQLLTRFVDRQAQTVLESVGNQDRRGGDATTPQSGDNGHPSPPSTADIRAQPV
jgi:hypothetical protein